MTRSLQPQAFPDDRLFYDYIFSTLDEIQTALDRRRIYKRTWVKRTQFLPYCFSSHRSTPDRCLLLDRFYEPILYIEIPKAALLLDHLVEAGNPVWNGWFLRSGNGTAGVDAVRMYRDNLRRAVRLGQEP